jgi:SEFIR domain
MPLVFLSYSHDSPEHRARVLALSEQLRRDGVDTLLDQYVEHEGPPTGWPRWTDEQIRRADFVLAVCTTAYRRRLEGKEEPGVGLGATWEGHLVYQEIYNAGTTNTKFVPVLLGDATDADVPLLLQPVPRYRADSPDGYEAMYRRLTGQPRFRRSELGPVRSLPTETPGALIPGRVARNPGSARKNSAAWIAAAVLAAIALTGGTTLVRHYSQASSEGPKTAHVRGTVIDSAQLAIQGTRVSLIGRSGSVVTDDSGSFDLPAGVADGTDVQIRAEHDGYRVSTLWHPAGDTPAVIVLAPEH